MNVVIIIVHVSKCQTDGHIPDLAVAFCTSELCVSVSHDVAVGTHI